MNTFYEDSTILISGGTGFLGKVLIEKLLRCFEVKRIYLLMRSKDDDNIQRRLQNLLQDKVTVNNVECECFEAIDILTGLFVDF